MNRVASTLAIDAPLIASTLFASCWLIGHTDRQIESALGLISTQWLHDMQGGWGGASGRPTPTERCDCSAHAQPYCRNSTARTS